MARKKRCINITKPKQSLEKHYECQSFYPVMRNSTNEGFFPQFTQFSTVLPKSPFPFFQNKLLLHSSCATTLQIPNSSTKNPSPPNITSTKFKPQFGLIKKLTTMHLWKQKYTWDQSINNINKEQWKILRSEWPKGMKEIPRFITNNIESMELYIFTDAPKLAYVAAVFIRYIDEENKITKSHLSYAKSRVAPIKDISIPKLELLSTLIGVRVGQFVLNQLWCHENMLPRGQTQNVSFWLSKSSDIATRKISPTKLRYNRLWWNGAYWLDKNPSEWPNGEFSYDAEDEIIQARWKAKSFKLPPMPNLPESRVQRSRTFEQKIMDENANFMAEKGIIWKNTIPRAPWDGGIYERLIGLTKETLERKKIPYRKEMTTLIAEIVGILNTRPLTYVGFDDYRIMRPIDFILPTVSLDVPIKYENEEEEYTHYILKTKNKLMKYWTNTLSTR
ncbi:Integrase core domain containing protein [Dirofilaria immitis]|nr:Integrase core domain containing protein [Dirofilaria immitis]